MIPDKKNLCKDCIYYNTSSCEGDIYREMLIEDYGYDCFTTEEYRLMCESLCREVLYD